ncbi:MAG TPA: ABC transporter permease [Myxococcales bacterium]|jgi:ABC-2 type transport system permease protein
MRARPSRHTQLLAVLRKETLQTVRDKRLMFMLMMAPVLQLIVFGYAIDLKVDRLPTVVADLDKTSESREHVRRLMADGTLKRAGEAESAEAAEAGLQSGQISAAIVIPRNFSRDLSRGEPTSVQVIIDGSDPNRSTVAAATVARYFAEAGSELVRARLADRGLPAPKPAVTLTSRIWFNPGMDTPPFMIPGVMAMLLIVVTTIVTAMGLAREREMGTLEQVLVTPVRPAVLLLGKMLPFVVMGIFDILFAMTIGAWLFAVPLRGSLAVIAVAGLCYLTSTLGVGLLISTVSRTQQQSFLGGFLFAMPAMLLSGAMTPIRSMPIWLQYLTYANPLRYFVEILRANMLTGAGFDLLWPRIVVLAGFGLTLLTVASLRFHKRVA